MKPAARFAGLTLTLLLAACGSTNQGEPVTDGQVPQSNTTVEVIGTTHAEPEPEVETKAIEEEVASTDNGSEVDRTEGEADVASLPPVDDDPDSFLSLDIAGLVARLGEPARIRREGQAEIHQYRGSYGGADCLLDLFLYPSDDAAELRVTYVELRGTSLTKAERRACLADMLRARLRVG